MSDRTWETETSRGDAAITNPGVTHDRTNEGYKDECRKALTDSEPKTKMRNW